MVFVQTLPHPHKLSLRQTSKQLALTIKLNTFMDEIKYQKLHNYIQGKRKSNITQQHKLAPDDPKLLVSNLKENQATNLLQKKKKIIEDYSNSRSRTRTKYLNVKQNWSSYVLAQTSLVPKLFNQHEYNTRTINKQ